MSTSETIRDLLDPRELPLRHRLGVVALGILALAPLWSRLLYAGGQDLLLLRTLTAALFLGMFAMSWDAVSGYTGQISFGHAVFFGVGGYSSALLNLGYGIPPGFAIVGGTVFAGLAGLVIGVPSLRLEGPYLSLVTLVAPIILLRVFVFRSDVFGGELGLPSPDPLVPTSGFEQATIVFFYVAFFTFLVILGVLLAVTRSDTGSVFTAIREDEDAVSAAGLNPAKFKIFAFLLSATTGGLAGAVFVHTIGKPTPSELLVTTVSIEVIIAAVLGGMGTIVGAAVGGIFLSLFRSYLSDVTATIPIVGIPIGHLDLLLFAVGTLLLLFYLPGGMVRWAVVAGKRRLADRKPAATDGGQTPIRQVAATWRRSIARLRGADDE